MNAASWIALCVASVAALSGQTPSPPPPAAVAIPLKTARHLEYSYDESMRQSTESHGSGMNGTGSGGSGSGVVSSFGSSGEHGTIVADVVAITTNGGIVVQIHDEPRYAARPGRTYTCTVFDAGRVSCSDLTRTATDTGTVEGPSQAEVLLLDFMGRTFIDPSRLDAKNHWQVAYDAASASVVEDFTMTDLGDGKPVSVTAHKRRTPHNQDVAAGTEDVTIAYDRALSVPDRVHDDEVERWSDGQLATTIDLVLLKDSFSAR